MGASAKAGGVTPGSQEVMEQDFDTWYGDLRPRMAAALAAWCGDRGLAAEAVDEAFVRAIERCPLPARWPGPMVTASTWCGRSAPWPTASARRWSSTTWPTHR
jgi:hypothetical protein